MPRLFSLLPVLAFSAAIATQAQSQESGPYVRPEAPGQMVTFAEGRRLHILCKGDAAAPTVIFEAGLSQYTARSTFSAAQDAIAPFARVCLYDRAGMGWSDPAPAGWTQENMVRDLHALLDAAHIQGPYVLAAHSLGGLLARAYVRAYPDDVVGLVLIDATSDRNLAEFEAARAATVPQIEAALVGSRPGVPVVGMPAGTSPEVVMAFTPEILRGVKVEFEALGTLPENLQPSAETGALGDLPLIVIRRGKTAQPPSEADINHREGQLALATLSSNSEVITAQNSGHTITLDEPQVVADAVRSMIEALRTATPTR